MAGGIILNAIIIEELEKAERKRELRAEQRQLRDSSNPFNLRDENFIKYFRLSKDSAHFLINQLSPFMRNTERATATPKSLKILAALHFFGNGGYRFGVRQAFLLGMSQPSISRCISEVSQLVAAHLLNQFISFPTTLISKSAVKQGFIEKFNLGGVIGAIDCTHIAIISPPAEDPNFPGRVYYNRKGVCSINTQIICSAKFQILNINARYPGSTHDAAIWRTSMICRHLQQQYVNGDTSYLLGDSGYPLQPWLLTPIEHAAPGTQKELYNTMHSTARSAIECVNGILKGRFRCLLKHITLNYDPIKAATIINTCAVLHNICIAFNDDMPNDFDANIENDNNADNNGQIVNAPNVDGNWLAQGEKVRNNLIRLL